MANSISVGGTLETTWSKRDPNDKTTYTFKLWTKLNSQDNSSNTSNITVKLYLKTNYGNQWAWSGGNWAKFYIYKAANGGSYGDSLGYTALGEFYGSTSYVEILSKDFTLTHLEDGTASYSVKGENVRGDYQDYQPYSGSGEITNISLPTIARFPKVRVNNGSNWNSMGTVWVYNGTTWLQAKEVYIYNGSNWVATTDRGS